MFVQSQPKNKYPNVMLGGFVLGGGGLICQMKSQKMSAWPPLPQDCLRTIDLFGGNVRGVGGWVRVHGLGKEVVVTAGSALGAFAKSSK